MKLYEVNAAIQELLLMLEPDPETGEVAATDDIIEQLGHLEMERSAILEYLAKRYQGEMNTETDNEIFKVTLWLLPSDN